MSCGAPDSVAMTPPKMSDSLRILVVQNHCIGFGGDDVVVASESSLLSAKGHEVSLWSVHNKDLKSLGSRIHTALSLSYSRQSKARLSRHIAEFRPDLMHCHNLFPRITVSAYDAAAEAGIPIVQTLHDFRFVCINSYLHRNGRICELCVAGSSYWGAWHRCYRNSWLGSLVTGRALDLQRRAGTLQQRVGCFIALSELSRHRFIAAGLPGERIVVKPNFVHPDPCTRTGNGEYALFVGRLSPEKGVRTVVAAWKRLSTKIPLVIIGDGPERTRLEAEAASAGLTNVLFKGQMPRDQALAAINNARFVVISSEWYETFCMVIAEAFACSTPVICSRMGAMQELVADGRTGLHYTPSDPDDLARKAEWAWIHPQEMRAMGKAGRAEYEARYTAEKNYLRLIQIYQSVLQSAS